MKDLYYDFHVNNFRLVDEAERLGYSGLALIMNGNNREEIPEWKNLGRYLDEHPLPIYKGVLIKARNPEDMRQKVKKFRSEAQVIMIHGGDQRINRSACEDPRVDIISNPYYNRRDCGINHVMARKAAQNQVAIELNIKHLSRTSSHLQYRILNYYREIVKLKRKFNFPLIITSDAQSIFDLHSPLDLIALSRCFGMEQEEAISALSETPQNIIEKSNMRNDVVVDGVKLIN
ncbi:MAG TPA: RNase P subunit p30 family protein [Methanobacterium sp.]|nr:RNase P subunit p30 family protein [Methanobacterium sp.]